MSDHVPAIDMSKFIPKTTTRLCLTKEEIYRMSKKLKIPFSLTKDDFPREILKNFAYELSNPLSIIYNSCLKTMQWPEIWKQEHVTVIPKIDNPKQLNDLRNISLTNHLSKQFEAFVREWILHDLKGKFDENQHGCHKGGRVEHCIIKLIDEIQRNADISSTNISILTSVDFSKAFNLFSHDQIVEKLKI